MHEVDLVFRIESDPIEGDRFAWSYDGGKNWRDFYAWADFDQMIKTAIGRFTVDRIIQPQLAAGEELCQPCRNRGKVGILRPHRRTTGLESVAKTWYEEDVEISGDVVYGVSYLISRCGRCGNEESDYA
jgi:hypothetical protein